MRFIPGLVLAFCLGLAATPSRAADPLLSESVALTGPVLWLVSGAPGMVLVVVRGHDSVIEGYGETEKGNKVEPTAKSLFRLGSISKVFTTEVLASLVVDDTVHLTDPLQQYAGSVTVPTVSGAPPITLLDLATHTAGLPREMGFAPEKPPFTWPTRDDRWAWLSHEKLGWAPGSVAAYSNIGFDFLADALATAAGQPYAALLSEWVTGPLSMKDTTLDPTPEECQRLMIGSGIGGPGPCVDTEATGGGGGLYSTGADMAIWLRHNLDTTNPVLLLSHAIYRPRQSLAAAIGFDDAGPMAGLGLGWVMLAAHGAQPMLLEKSGGGGGFMTYIAFAPGRDVGAFVVVNRVDFGMFAGLTKGINDLIANLVTR
jgi:D-alanyl-D-alanine-carboxypeptidase/D-alanyl-D-alanine-endopeptidase